MRYCQPIKVIKFGYNLTLTFDRASYTYISRLCTSALEISTSHTANTVRSSPDVGCLVYIITTGIFP